MNALNSFEIGILDFIAEHFGCKFLDIVMPIITMLGDGGVFWITIAVIMLFFKSTRKTALTMGMALVMGLLVCNVTLKPLVGRIRPYELREVALLIKAPHDASFPSGHTAVSFAAAGVVALRRSKLAIPALILASIIAFSRLYLYVHFPTDVLGGILVGMICALLGCSFGSRLCKKLRWED